MTKRNLLHLVFDCPMKMGEPGRTGSESDDPDSPEYTFRECGRDQERRNTDFSQADNDLKRFLSEREHKRRDSAEQVDILLSPTYNPESFRKDIFPTRLFGSVEKIDDFFLVDPDGVEKDGVEKDDVENNVEKVGRRSRCESLGAKDSKKIRDAIRRANMTSQIKNRRFRVESCDNSIDRQESLELTSTPVLENPENQTLWYSKYFLGKVHYNFVGLDNEKSAIVLSVVEERSFGKAHCRCILWTKDGPKRLVIPGSLKGRGANLNSKSILAQFQHGAKIDQPLKEVSNAYLQRDLFSLEKQERAMNLKFGVIYAKSGQLTDDEFFSNNAPSESFEKFLTLLGDRIRLKGWHRYRGGLDVRNDMTGTHSVYTVFEEHEIMFHVSTLLPFSEDDSQQLDRKRHIGNDIVNIVFIDGSFEETALFQPQFIKSHFTHIYAVVCYQFDTNSYHVSVLSDDSVPLFGPLLTNLAQFSNHQDFRRFLLCKLINGEKAAYKANVFSSKREKTFEMLLQDMFDQYVIGGDAESGKSIKQLYGSQRKVEDQKDLFVKMGQTLRLDSMLTSGSQFLRESKNATKSPWEPTCVYANFPHQVLCGDSWGNFAMLLGTTAGTFLVSLNTRTSVIVFDKSVSTVVQLNVIEPYDMMIARVERHRGGEGGKLIVFRLSDLEEFLADLIEWHHHVDTLLHRSAESGHVGSWGGNNVNNSLASRSPDSQQQVSCESRRRPHWEPRTKSDLRSNIIEASKGCTILSVSRSSPLRIVFAVGKRIVVMKWRHAEAWISLTTDTADGFEMEAEFHTHETPTIVALIKGPSLVTPGATALTKDSEDDPSSLIDVVAGSRHHFEMIRLTSGEKTSGESVKLFSMPSSGCNKAISITEIVYDKEPEVLLSYNSSTHVQKLESNANPTHKIEWNSVPFQVVCAFPYILAVTQEAVEFRYAINGSLLQTLCMPELKLITSKDDLFFVSTRQPVSTRKPLDGGYQDQGYRHIYKIPYSQLVGATSTTTSTSTTAASSTMSPGAKK